MFLQPPQGASMNVQLPPVGSVQQTTTLTNQIQQIQPSAATHTGSQQITIQPPPQPTQQTLQQHPNTLAQVHTHTHTHTAM